jgi:DNA mismatch repair protein MutL
VVGAVVGAGGVARAGWGALADRAAPTAAESAAALAFWAPLPPASGATPEPCSPASLPGLLPEAPRGEPGLPRELDSLRVLFQLHRTYIVCEHPDGLFLLDQHNSHERWIYEQLRPAEVVSQALLMPVVLPLSPREEGLAEEFGPRLAALGFELAPFGSGRWILRGIPALLPLDEAEATVRELLSGAERNGVVVRQPDDDPIRRTIACHAAVRAGDVLSMDQMEQVVARLREARHPLTCPHGRPTGIMISMQELARRCLRA